MKDRRQVVLSGIRATGQLHLGNFLGAIQHFVELAQDPDNDCYYFIANLHTLTTRQDPDRLQADLRNIVLDYLACGLDPERCTIYAQSSVPEISELAWLLACLTPVHGLMNMHHFQEKRDDLEGAGLTANAGLLTYPVLMAADILGPHANLVPVGQDQHAHVELAREVARRFNYHFGNTFPIPDLLDGPGIRVPGLSASGKMGKSDAEGSIMLTDDQTTVDHKFRRAITDPQRQKRSDPGDPQVCNIYTFHQLLSTAEQLQWAHQGCTSAGIGCLECKTVVAGHVNDILAPIRERRRELLAQGIDRIDDIIREGGLKARQVIAPHVAEAKDKMGVPFY